MERLILPATVGHVSGKRRRSAGFTLVEMLVVIAIIGLLAALVTRAVAAALYAAKNTRIKTEIDNLDSAMKSFKDKIGGGAYPPADLHFEVDPRTKTLVPNPQLRAFLARAFPRYEMSRAKTDFSALNIDVSNPNYFDPAAALVFWLGGVSDDPANPWGDATRQFNDPQNDAYRKRQPLFDFDKGRLKTPTPVYGLSTGAVAKYDPQSPMQYLASYGNAPYVYFDNKSYYTPNLKKNDFDPNFSNIRYWAVGDWGIVSPYVRDNDSKQLEALEEFTDSNKNGTYDVGEPIKGNGGALHVNPATDQYANPDSFQIISAGQDGRFGFALPSSGPPPLPAKLFPIGGGYSPYDGDNIVNFTEKKSLDDAKP